MNTMLKTFIFLLIFVSFYSIADAQIGIFEQSTDVGKVKIKGDAVFEKQSGQYHLKGSGKNMWDKQDEFHFLYRFVKEDFTLNSAMSWVGKGVALHRKAGLMIRESLDTGSRYVSIAVHGDGLVSMQYRLEKDSVTKEIRAQSNFLSLLELNRNGDTITIYATDSIQAYSKIGSIVMNFQGKEVYVGLFVCSHESKVLEEVIFDKTSLRLPSDFEIQSNKPK